MMTALLLLARPLFAALLVAVVGLYIWTGYQADLRAPAAAPSPDQPKGQRGK
jgi:hypothetical protein